ncbi:MAG: DUF4810 domain-containing protein [Alphaproteobacteria bacterium]|nr:DUF4810 domain-containing protein [Alphaproteobacteria bacterium]
MFKTVLAAASACVLVGCATPSRFEWGGYEGSLYAYAKHPETRENYRKTLVAAIDKGERTNRLAPGLYAELGYLNLEDGQQTEAVADFKKEMAAFPEARPFLTGVIERIDAGHGVAPAPQDASSPAPTVTEATASTPTS